MLGCGLAWTSCHPKNIVHRLSFGLANAMHKTGLFAWLLIWVHWQPKHGLVLELQLVIDYNLD